MRLLFVLLSCAAIALASSKKSYDGYKVYSIQLTSADQLTAFLSLQKYNIDFWERANMNGKPFRVMIEPQTIEAFESFLKDHQITSQILVKNAADLIAQELSRNAAVPRRSRGSGRSLDDFDHFYRYEEITEFLEGVAKDHSNLVTLESAGKSTQGRDLWMVKISNTGFNGTKPVIFMEANIHAREWIAVMTTLMLIHNLTDYANDYPEMFAADWMIIPMSNPDGYEHSHLNDRMWRKTMSKNNGSQCLGTDPNRNFAYKWELETNASDNPCSDAYRGPGPETEPEVQAISNVLRQNKNRIKLYVAVHSFGEYLLYPFGYALNIPNRSEANLKKLGDRCSDAIKAVNPSHSYTVGNAAHALYPVSGASDDFAAGEVGINTVFTVELSGDGEGFIIDKSKIPQISQEIFAAYREMAIYVGETF